MSKGLDNGKNREEQMKAFLLNGRASSSDSDILFSYVGIIDQDKVQQIVAEIEELLINSNTPKGKVKKTFTILIEGLQNMAIHSASISGQRTAGIELAKIEEALDIKILGLADGPAVQKVDDAVSKLNSMDRPALKAHYRDVMENGVLSAKGGAGLGLITMVMKADGPMKVSSEELEDGFHILSHALKV